MIGKIKKLTSKEITIITEEGKEIRSKLNKAIFNHLLDSLKGKTFKSFNDIEIKFIKTNNKILFI